MSTHIVTAPTGTLPVREDGAPYPFAMNIGDDVVLADSRTELVGHLIPGYSELPAGKDGDEKALWARYECAVKYATVLQGVLAANAEDEGVFKPSLLNELQLTALFEDKDTPIRNTDRVCPWDEQVALIAISLHYEPFMPHPLPTGNVTLLDPHCETSLLDSLSSVGVISLAVHESHDEQ